MSSLEHFAFALNLDSNSITHGSAAIAERDAQQFSFNAHDRDSEDFAGVGGAQFERYDFGFDACRPIYETWLAGADEEPQSTRLRSGGNMDHSE